MSRQQIEAQIENLILTLDDARDPYSYVELTEEEVHEIQKELVVLECLLVDSQ